MDKTYNIFKQKYFICTADNNDKTNENKINFKCKIKNTYEEALEYKCESEKMDTKEKFIVETRGPMLFRQFQVEKKYKATYKKEN